MSNFWSFALFITEKRKRWWGNYGWIRGKWYKLGSKDGFFFFAHQRCIYL